MLTNGSKIDPRVKRTRKLLQQALADLLKEKTFQSITVQDIAERAEVNRATFYAHFDDKYALMNYSVRKMFQEMLDHKLPEAPTLTPDNLRLLMLTICDYIGGFLGHCVPSPHRDDQVFMVAQVQAHTDEVLRTWIARSPRKASQIAPETIAMVVSWTIFGSVLQWSQGGRKIPAEQFTAQVLNTLIAGLLPYLADV